MVRVSTPGLLAGFFVAAVAAPLSTALPAFAQSEITVFAPFRGIATPIARAGSAVSVITREEIEQAGQVSVAEILRASPGVSFNSSGGFGSSTDVRIRGAESQHTMVLIDGVPVTDTTSTRNAFDFTMLPVGSIERIEVLRGPQSALYGSDAIGGVIAISTRQPTRGLSGSASVEGGSFGTHREILQASYGGETFGLHGQVEHVSTEGYSRRADNNEADGAQQWSLSLRGQVQLSESLEVDGAFQFIDLESEYDAVNPATFASDPAGSGLSERQSINGHARLSHDSFDGRWRQTLTVSASTNDRTFKDIFIDDTYDGDRFAAEYVGQVNHDTLGILLYGLSTERQSAEYINNGTVQFSQSEIYWGAFAMHQFSLSPSFHLSTAVRFDDFADAGTFVTGRGTAVYEMYETETRFHASLGSGGKAPSLRQRAATPGLLPEESWGVDVGVTQTLFDGRLTVDVTGFYQEIEQLHDYTGAFFTNGNFALESWANVDLARLQGIEVTADARLVPGHLDASAHYTYLDAIDATNGLRLQRRPEHEAQLTLTYIGVEQLRLSGTVNWVGGERYSRSRERSPLDPYVRVDLNASYRAHDHLELYGRVENLFDVDYEEVSGTNTPGLSAYAGIRATF